MKRTIRRRVVKSLIIITALVLLLLVGVQCILAWSNWPRDLVISQIRDQTGLKVEMDRLRATWSGNTHVLGLRVYDPATNQVAIAASDMRIHHASLLQMAFGGGLNLQSIKISGVALNLVQDNTSQWNLQSMLEQVKAHQQPSAEPDAPVSLPEVDLKNVRLNATLASGEQVTLGSVSASIKAQDSNHKNSTGDATPALAFVIHADKVLAAQGTLKLAGVFEHHVELQLESLKPLEQLIHDSRWLETQASLKWQGSIENQILSGKLTIDQLKAGDDLLSDLPLVEATGKLDVATGKYLTLKPSQLKITAGQWLPETLTVEQGSLQYSLADRQLALTDLLVTSPVGQIGVKGSMSIDGQQGKGVINWRDVKYPLAFEHQGSVNISLERQGPLGQIQLTASGKTQGTSPQGKWDVALETSARGPDWDQLDWNLLLSPASWEQGKTTYLLPMAEVQGKVRGNTLRMDQFTLPVSVTDQGVVELKGKAELDLLTQRWTMDAKVLSQIVEGKGRDASGTLALTGSATQVRGSIDNIQIGPLTGQVSGQADWGLWNKAVMQFNLSMAPPTTQQPVTWENMSLKGSLQGTIVPLKLRLFSQASAKKILTGKAVEESTDMAGPLYVPEQNKPVSTESPVTASMVGTGTDVLLALRGDITNQGITLRSQPASLLGSTVQLSGEHRFDTQHTSLVLKSQDFSLERADQVVRKPLHLSGMVDLNITAGLDHFDTETLDIQGTWSTRDFKQKYLPLLQAAGRVVLQDGQLNLLDVVAESGQGKASGEIHSGITTVNRVHAKMSLDKWPLSVPGEAFTAYASGQAQIDGDLSSQNFTGPSDLQISLFREKQLWMLARLKANLTSHHLQVTSIDADVLGGNITGQGNVDLSDLHQSTVAMDIKDIDLTQLLSLSPRLATLQGKTAGRITLAHDDDVHALGPMKLDILLEPQNAKMQQVELGPLKLEAYLGNDRVLVNHFEVDMAQGKLSMWGRVTRHDQEWFTFAKAQWKGLSIDQLATLSSSFAKSQDTDAQDENAEKPQPVKPIPGLVDGNMQVTGPLFDWTRASGGGELVVRDSDLIRIPIFNELYGLLNVAFPSDKNDGHGRAAYRLEGTSFLLTDAAYVNRGMSIDLRMRIVDLTQGMQSPIRGLAVAIFNPLPELPVLSRYIDAIMNYQGSVTSLSILGTIENQKLQRVPNTVIDVLARELIKPLTALGSSKPADPPAVETSTEPGK